MSKANLPGDPSAKKAHREAVTKFFQRMVGSASLLSIIFRGAIGRPRPPKRNPAKFKAKRTTQADIDTFYARRPRPWRRACDAPRQPALEVWRLRRRAKEARL